jgi:hypothetical protein
MGTDQQRRQESTRYFEIRNKNLNEARIEEWIDEREALKN